MSDKWQNYINKVVRWAKTRSYDVEFHPNYDDKMDDCDKIVYISTRFNSEIQLYGLLHECGHLLIRKNKSRYNKTYPVTKNYTQSIHKGIAKSKRYQVDIIAEEIDAWRVGKNLAKRLKIGINEDNYNSEMGKYVYYYVEDAYKTVKKKK